MCSLGNVGKGTQETFLFPFFFFDLFYFLLNVSVCAFAYERRCLCVVFRPLKLELQVMVSHLAWMPEPTWTLKHAPLTAGPSLQPFGSIS